MRTTELLRRRLAASLLTGPRPATAAEVVAHLGAVQAQDYGQSLWAVGCRTARPSRAAVEAEIAAGALVRTWPMRGTLHLIRPVDVRWMLDLCAGRAMRAAAGRHRQLGLDGSTLLRAEDVVLTALDVGPRTRPELFAALESAGIATGAQRGVHVLGHLAHRGLLVVGARIGRQPGYVRFDPPPSTLAGDEALAEIARRYLRGHGPASARDLQWWTGLTLAETRRALALIADDTEQVGDLHHLPGEPPPLPSAPLLLAGFDEYVLAYADRGPVLGDVPLEAVVPGRNGMFLPTVIRRGRVVGTWRNATGEVTDLAGAPETGPAYARYRRFADDG